MSKQQAKINKELKEDTYSIFHVEGGIGKNIIATNIAKGIKDKYPERNLVIVSPYPEIFLNNPNIYRCYKMGMCPFFYDDFIKNKDSKIFKHEPYNCDSVILRSQSLINAWKGLFNLTIEDSNPELFFNNVEENNVQVLYNKVFQGKPIIALQINGGVPLEKNNQINFNWYRDLPPKQIQKLINEFSNKYTFIQIKHPGQITLNNVTPVDSLSVREVLLLLSKCDGAVCIDSFVQHAMAAFGIKSLVFWIGNSPIVFGHEIHQNVVTKLNLNQDNIEGYLEPYPLVTQGYQCPSNYHSDTVFSYKEIKDNFLELYGNLN